MKKAFLDSNILIYRSKQQLDFEAIASKYDALYVSVISFIEALGYPFKNLREREIIEGILENLEIVQTDMSIAEQVVRYKQLRRIKTPDAIILATAKSLGAELVTVNVGDFLSLDPSVSIFVPPFSN